MPRPDDETLREFLDRFLRHAILLEREKTDLVAGIVLREYIPRLEAAIDDLERDFRSLKTFQSGDPTLERKAFRAAIAKSDGKIAKAVAGLRAKLDERLLEVAVRENGFAARLTTSAFDVPTRTIPKAAARAIRDARPFNGKYLKEWYSELEKGTQAGLRAAVRQGVVNGEPVSRVVRRLRGTPTAPGILKTTRHQAELVVRTSMHHVATRAQRAAFEDVKTIEEERWVSTLDSRTCPACGGLDGRIYKKTGGPVPPLHPFCRCLRLPWTGRLFGSRAAQGGPAKATETFGDWLRRQPVKTQREVLGSRGAELFRSGRMRIEQFSDVNHRPISVAEMNRINESMVSRPMLAG